MRADQYTSDYWDVYLLDMIQVYCPEAMWFSLGSKLLLFNSTKAVIICKPSYTFTIFGVLVLILGIQRDFLRGRFPEIIRFFLFLEASSVVLLVFEVIFLRDCYFPAAQIT